MCRPLQAALKLIPAWNLNRLLFYMRSSSNETFVAPLFGSIQGRPESLRALNKLHDLLLGPGALKERLKLLVYMAVSIVNESAYCAKEAEIKARELGITEDECTDIEAETDYSFPEKERAALRYARELTRTAAAESNTQDMLDNHFTADERVELTLVIALANMTSRVANGLRLPSEEAILPVAS